MVPVELRDFHSENPFEYVAFRRGYLSRLYTLPEEIE